MLFNVVVICCDASPDVFLLKEDARLGFFLAALRVYESKRLESVGATVYGKTFTRFVLVAWKTNSGIPLALPNRMQIYRRIWTTRCQRMLVACSTCRGN